MNIYKYIFAQLFVCPIYLFYPDVIESLSIRSYYRTIIASRKRTFVEWGRGLTMDEYLDRDAVGEGEEFGRDEKLMTWYMVLAPRDNPTTIDFFCSCETFKRTIAISYPDKDAEEGVGYGIASVFTAKQFRGKGYGKHMMRLLHWVLAREDYLQTQQFPEEWGAPPPRVSSAGDGWLSALWSDVGPTYYSLCGMDVGGRQDGWIVKDPFSTFWKLKDVSIPEDEDNNGEVVWLDEKAAKGMWDKDTDKIKAELVQKAKEENQMQFSFLPNNGVAMFQWFRLHYHFSRYVQDPPKYCGLRVGEEVFATWTCEFRPGTPKTLTVTRLRADKERIRGVLVDALRYARKHGMDEVEVWNLAPEYAESARELGGAVVRREEHFPAVKWYGAGEVGWATNEKYAWC
ncbi:hypothetical protein AGABI2DRAFT_206303 [Agaricus bisporus var. bisporus H97]|uniref:hypothetical protein n=1 Tax=Agaricus bisporus var. bisporus (strain H97 / ATCC MYA-4626 / FGSC 10389) TaxID=936046 RepID=UPI00029F4EC8|nr:hypothetical protein AGABI2DRAFT_206303 [Agaricus bisporus var. bisporus H97]EKV46778.1 hypothetical protein AGABI2DRAFT_206303 [Agaricus bisporus var. bisporus H97]